jgi:predicted phage tail component-like protein
MFNFNGIDFSNKNIKVVEIQRPLIAPQKISTTSIEGKAEEVFHRRVSASYNIDVEFYLFSATGLTLISDIRDLAGDLDTSGPAVLKFNDEPDKYVKAIVEETEIEKKGRYAIITVSFKVLDPYWYALSDDVFTYTTVGAKSFSRKGNAESFPLIEVEGTSSASGSFTVTANGLSVKYTGALVAGEKLVLDSALLTSYILKTDGVTKVSTLNKLDNLDFPVLRKGQNDFSITVAGGASLTKCKVTCNSRWK